MKGNRAVTAEISIKIKIGMFTNTSPQMWLHMQADYDLWHALKAR